MFRKLRDVPECLGNIDGVDYEADIRVRLNSQPKMREKIIKHLEGAEGYDKIDTISLDKEYHVHKITSYGDPFDVWIINDLGKEEKLCEAFFEDIDD